jgi:hypothetical protein
VILIAGFAEVDFVAHPIHVAFGAIASLEVVRRLNELSGGGLIGRLTPADVFQPWLRTAVKMLNPNLPENLNRREFE